MKPLTNVPIDIRIKGLSSDLVEKIDFLFKAIDSPSAEPLLVKSYPDGGVTYNCGKGAYRISLTAEETALFPNGSFAYVEAFPVTSDGRDIPVGIGRFNVNKTMRKNSDIPEGGEGDD